MRYSRKDLLQLKDYKLSVDENIQFADDISKQFPRIRRINEINVKADGKFNPEQQRLYVDFKVKGSVICGCDITGEDVEVPVDVDSEEIFSFNRKEEDISIYQSNGEFIELLPVVFQLIMMEIPIKVVKPGKIEYPKGDGWEVVDEKTYQQQKESKADPRLAIFKELKPHDE